MKKNMVAKYQGREFIRKGQGWNITLNGQVLGFASTLDGCKTVVDRMIGEANPLIDTMIEFRFGKNHAVAVEVWHEFDSTNREADTISVMVINHAVCNQRTAYFHTVEEAVEFAETFKSVKDCKNYIKEGILPEVQEQKQEAVQEAEEPEAEEELDEMDAVIRQLQFKSDKTKEAVQNILQKFPLPEGLTKKQESTLMQVIRNIPEFDFYGFPESNDYEVKEFKVEPITCGIYVTFTTGIKSDEGTFASILCRKYRRFFIGQKGGIQIINSKSKLTSCSLFELMNRHYEH